MPRIGFGGSKGLLLLPELLLGHGPEHGRHGRRRLLCSPAAPGPASSTATSSRAGRRATSTSITSSIKRQGDGTKPGSSSIVRLNHTQALPFGFTLVANVDYQTSYGFLREYDNDFQRALSFNRTSQVYLSRSWRRFNLSARASRFETYFSELDDANVSTSLPQITFNVFKTRLFAPGLLLAGRLPQPLAVRLEVRLRGRDGAAVDAPLGQPDPEPAFLVDPLADGHDLGHGQPQLLRPEPRPGDGRHRRRAPLHPERRRRGRGRRARLLPDLLRPGRPGPAQEHRRALRQLLLRQPDPRTPTGS
ncbi:MAG: LPS-assembly protein LptD [Candidatus Moduliflexus flocculans]|nr:LPS-assembly protein LptD [Candidatus Moduliflexus flocculans]